MSDSSYLPIPQEMKHADHPQVSCDLAQSSVGSNWTVVAQRLAAAEVKRQHCKTCRTKGESGK